MLDKNLIENNFKKSITTYNNNAYIQEHMAQKLVSLIKKDKFNSILEIGSYTGILTKKIIENFKFDNYIAVDIVDSYSYIENLSPKINFIKSDIENFTTDKKFDLIISNATLQWCSDFNSTLKKIKNLLSNDGIIAISIFGNKNLYEIKQTFNVSLKYPSENEIKNIFSKNVLIINESMPLKFNNPIDILKHLKYTGVNSISKNNYTISYIKNNLEILSKKFNNTITYNPVYIID